MRLLLLLSAAAIALPVQAATLRPQTTLAGPVVRLSDLFDDAGPEAARVLGPAPAPGGRIVVEARQLGAIARQFGVDWRPASGTERIVLDRPGRMLPREDVVAALRTALAGLGADPGDEIELPAYAAPMVPPDAVPKIAVEQMDQDGAGRFTAQLAVLADGMDIQRVRVSGMLVRMVELPVPVRRLDPGRVLQAGDFRMARVRAGLVHGEVLAAIARAVGQSVRHPAMAGLPVPLAELAKPIAVARGARVVMELSAPGLHLTGVARAMGEGSVGDRILVQNPASRAVIDAEIVGRDRVRVEPGSMPVQAAGTQLAAVR